MYAKCREYLIDRLRASGIQMEPITSLKKLQLYRNSHVGAVLFDEETLERDGSRRVFKDTDGNPKTRTCLFKRRSWMRSTRGFWRYWERDCISTAILFTLNHLKQNGRRMRTASWQLRSP